MPFTSATAKKARCRKGGLHAAAYHKANDNFSHLKRARAISIAKRIERAYLNNKCCDLCRPVAKQVHANLQRLRFLVLELEQGKAQYSAKEKALLVA